MDDKKQQPQVAPELPRPVLQAPPPQPPRKRRPAATLLLIVCAALLVAGAGVFGYVVRDEWYKNTETTPRQSTQRDGNAIITKEEEDISTVAAKVSASVVSIVTKTTSVATPYSRSRVAEGAGTGIIVGRDGYILTNKHVIDEALSVGVVLSDGTNYDNVTVLGSDPLNDIAFLKIADVSDLPAAELGDSTSIRIGQKVIAIGNSLGMYQNTVTSGIISGTGRPVTAQSRGSMESLTDLIQTDAAINPGNSGGPLLNLQGQVIGVNTAIVKSAQGIGFAIPIGAAKGALKGVLKGESVKRAYLGVNYLPINAAVAREYKLPVKKGAYVYAEDSQSAVVADGPAQKSGIRNGDIITNIGSIAVGDRGGVASLVAEYAPGDTISLTLLRGDKRLTTTVVLGAYDASR